MVKLLLTYISPLADPPFMFLKIVFPITVVPFASINGPLIFSMIDFSNDRLLPGFTAISAPTAYSGVTVVSLITTFSNIKLPFVMFITLALSAFVIVKSVMVTVEPLVISNTVP